MNPTQTRPKSETRNRIVGISIAGIVTVAAWIWALSVRQFLGQPILLFNDLTRLQFDPAASGVFIQALLVPLVLIYLFSAIPSFRRVVSGEARSRDGLKLFGMLVLIQCLTLAYDLSLFPADWTAFGLFIVIVGGFLSGWRVGLMLGLVTMLISGTYIYISGTRGMTIVHLLNLKFPPDAPAGLPWKEAIDLLGHEFLFFYVANLRASIAIWGGVIAGVCLGLVKERWLAPAAAFGFGAAIEFGAGYLIGLAAPAPGEFLNRLIGSTLMTGLAFAAVALIVRGVQADVARRKAEATKLALARAELRALRAQIKPHFLFNALNTIRYFVRTDPDTARQLLLNLSEVFQRAIRSGESVPLRDELSYVDAYLSLEKARLGDRLQVVWAGQVTEPGTLSQDESPVLDNPIPTLSLEPIVENAIVHGISKKPEGGTVHITIERAGSDLLIQVEDNGVGIEPTRLADLLKPAGAKDSSIGLRNVDGRLRALYGEDYALAIESTIGHGTRVKIKIPVERTRNGG